MLQINMDTKFNFAKRIWTVEQFAEKFNVPAEQAFGTLTQLVELGKATPIDETDMETRKQEALLEKALKELEVINAVESYDMEKVQEKQFKQAIKSANQLKHKGYYLLFPTQSKAEEFQDWVTQVLFLSSSIEILTTQYGKQYKLNVFDITDAQISTMDKKHALETTIDKTVGVVDNTLNGVATGVDYTAQKIIAPLTQVTARTVARAGGTLAKTGVRTASTLVSSIFQGVKECSHDLKYDQDVLRARKELTETKNDIIKVINNHKVNSSGARGGYLD